MLEAEVDYLHTIINRLRIVGDGGRPFAQPGDSGALVVTYDEVQATGIPLGLLFATATVPEGGNWFSPANSIHEVMRLLNICRL
jgi:hypothetical protein